MTRQQSKTSRICHINLVLPFFAALAICTAFAQIPVAKLPQEKINPSELEFCKPFLESAKGYVDCEVTVDQGVITVHVITRSVLTQARSDSSGEPGEFVRDWEILFVMCPIVSRDDLSRIRRYEEQYQRTIRSKSDLRSIYSADIKTSTNWFRVVSDSYHPVRKKDLESMKEFIERLSTKCTTIEGGNPKELLTKAILKDPLLDE
jgi:hypothetical protein